MTIDGPVDLLVIEDITRSRTSVVIALEDSVPLINIVAVANGKSALDFVLNRGEWLGHNGGEIPDLILLDLCKPGGTAFSLLGRIDSIDVHSGFVISSVAEFTEGPATTEAARIYQCGANGYGMFPFSYTDVPTVVAAVGRNWVKLDKTPTA